MQIRCSDFIRVLAAVSVMMLAEAAAADELTRAVQEQLRVQGAYSGPVDGKPSEELTKALKDFQQRHNLPASGVLDRATAKALDDESGLALPESSTKPQRKTPIPSPSRTPAPVATPTASPLPQATSPPPIPSQSPTTPPITPSPTPNKSPTPMEQNSPPEISPSSPAEGPSQPFTVERVTTFLRNYFDEGEDKSVTTQLRFYSFPVSYFGHAKVNSQFVRNQILRTMRRWPRRSYRLKDDVVVTPVSAETATAEFTVFYTLQRGKQKVTGHKNDRVTLRDIKGALKIVAISERRG